MDGGESARGRPESELEDGDERKVGGRPARDIGLGAEATEVGGELGGEMLCCWERMILSGGVA
jgi:hypothetical protein